MCTIKEKRTLGCFYGPDSRAFSSPHMTAVYTLFIREHNRIASELISRNLQWSDETTFQEARRILIAIYQNIVYKEFLPLTVGKDYMKKFDLNPLKSGHGSFYNNYLYPNVYNELNVAKLINYYADQITLVGDQTFKFSDTLFRQDLSYQNLELFMKAMVEQRSMRGGFAVSDSLLNNFRFVNH